MLMLWLWLWLCCCVLWVIKVKDAPLLSMTEIFLSRFPCPTHNTISLTLLTSPAMPWRRATTNVMARKPRATVDMATAPRLPPCKRECGQWHGRACRQWKSLYLLLTLLTLSPSLSSSRSDLDGDNNRVGHGSTSSRWLAKPGRSRPIAIAAFVRMRSRCQLLRFRSRLICVTAKVADVRVP